MAAGKAGLDLAFATSSVTAIWAPTGIALAALVVGGLRLWPAVALGALVTNTDTGVPALTVVGITVGNTLEAVVGTALLRRATDFRPSLERVRDVLSLVFFAAILSTLVSATIGVLSLLAGDALTWDAAPRAWRTWWLGDMGGDLIVAPALLVAATLRPFPRLPGRPLEAVAVTAALAAVSVLIFSQDTTLVYVVFPLLIWAALRFWQPGAVAASLLMAPIAIGFTAAGEGPFAASGPDERLLLAQTLVAVAGVTALVLAAITAQRDRAERTAREIAGTLQESLLPGALPPVPGIELATYYQPAGEGYRVGGDFYDVFELGDGTWGLVMGDVCGKGPRAAALTALTRYTLRAVAAQDRSPAAVLAALNEAVLRQCHGEEFCTTVYGRLDLHDATARFTLCSAGHPLPLIVRNDGSVEEVGISGTLLGVDPRPTLSEHTVQIGPGESMFFFTDGLTDAYAPRHIVQASELEAVLRRCIGHTAAATIATVKKALLDTPVGEPRDDIALVALRHAG